MSGSPESVEGIFIIGINIHTDQVVFRKENLRGEYMDWLDKCQVCDQGFTGLEAAIVLIAFVVVAAVFSYVILGAGFYTSQTAQATVHTSVGQASSSLDIIGNVYGFEEPTNMPYLAYINITVALTAGGMPMDMSQMVVSYNDGTTNWPNMANAGENCWGPADVMLGSITNPATQQGSWCIAQVYNNVTSDTSTLLGPNEQYVLAIQMPDTTTPNSQFTVHLQPSVGTSLSIQRTIPGSLTPVMALN